MTRSEPSTHETLIEAVCSRPVDDAAWGRFVALYGPHVVGWCRRYGLQDADARDVAQDVLMQFARQAGRFRYDRSRRFRGFLRTITHAAWCDWVERRRTHGPGCSQNASIEMLEEISARDDLTARLEAEFDQELLRMAMDKVKLRVEARTWEAFRLLAIEGLSGVEASARVGMQLGSAFAARHKVQRLLRETIQALEL